MAEIQTDISPSLFVEDAMHQAVSSLISMAEFGTPPMAKLYPHLQKRFKDPESLKLSGVDQTHEYLEYATGLVCEQGAKLTALTVWKRYRQHFPVILLLKAPPLPNIQNDWPYHFYFLLQDTAGIWYMGSPSNHYPPSNDLNYLFRYEKGSLQEVLRKSAEEIDVILPTAEQVEAALNDQNNRTYNNSTSNQPQPFDHDHYMAYPTLKKNNIDWSILITLDNSIK